MSDDVGLHVVVVGLGAIGSFFVVLLARLPWVARVTLVDFDRYTEANLHSQLIYGCDVGELKAAAQARRMRAANPGLEVCAIPERVENVPMGRLRGDLIVGCTDTKVSRQFLSELAFRLRAPFLDSGVLGAQHLARASVFVPGPSAPCGECSWDAAAYALLETEYPCGTPAASGRPSDTDAVLASLAAGLLANECEKLVADGGSRPPAGYQVTLDAGTLRLATTSFTRVSTCRFDHRAFQIAPLHRSLRAFTVADALAVCGAFRVSGHRFTLCSACPRCGHRLNGLRLDRPRAVCPACGVRMTAPEFGALLDELTPSLSPEHLGRSLAQIGLLGGDVLVGTEKQFELVAEDL
jgi:molybdopterin/thiamine biosynthesis adenylyltransferase